MKGKHSCIHFVSVNIITTVKMPHWLSAEIYHSACTQYLQEKFLVTNGSSFSAKMMSHGCYWVGQWDVHCHMPGQIIWYRL